MAGPFDARAWNLLGGLSLIAAGCGAGVPTQGEATGNQTTTTESDGDTDDGGEEQPPECQVHTDCPPSYACVAGSCEYDGSQDGGGYEPECVSDLHCEDFELCISEHCEAVGSPPACDVDRAGLAIPLAIDDTALALSFADVDGDQRAELVVASETQLYVFECGSAVPSISARELGSSAIDAMVSGRFASEAHDDIVIVHDQQLVIHESDGSGMFLGAPSASQHPLAVTTGAISRELDGQGPPELLIWGDMGAVLVWGADLGTGAAMDLGPSAVDGCAARGLGEAASGFLLSGPKLRFYTPEATLIGEAWGANINGSGPVVAFTGGGQPLYASATTTYGWTVLEVWDPLGDRQTLWGLPVPGRVGLASGDVDGDGEDDLIITDEADNEVWVQFSPLTSSNCLQELAFGVTVQQVVVGDHDGDGDDEFAVHLDTNPDFGEILLFDGEG